MSNRPLRKIKIFPDAYSLPPFEFQKGGNEKPPVPGSTGTYNPLNIFNRKRSFSNNVESFCSFSSGIYFESSGNVRDSISSSVGFDSGEYIQNDVIGSDSATSESSFDFGSYNVTPFTDSGSTLTGFEDGSLQDSPLVDEMQIVSGFENGVYFLTTLQSEVAESATSSSTFVQGEKLDVVLSGYTASGTSFYGGSFFLTVIATTSPGNSGTSNTGFESGLLFWTTTPYSTDYDEAATTQGFLDGTYEITIIEETSPSNEGNSSTSFEDGIYTVTGIIKNVADSATASCGFVNGTYA